MARQVGTSGDDFMIGTDLYGGDGDDTLQADSTLPSHLYGGAGADWFLGDGAANIFANLGTSPEDETDKVRFFGTGDYHIVGGEGAKDINLGEGEGSHYIRLQGGNDLVVAGGDNDISKSGSGRTEIYLGNKPTWETTDGGVSYHEVDHYTGTGKSRVMLGNTSGPATVRTAEGNDSIVGGSGNDEIRAGGGDNRIDGGAGNDYIEVDAGHSIVLGGSGNDVLRSNGPGNILKGGAGDDVIYGGAGDHLDGGDGNDTIFVNNRLGGGITTVANFETLNIGDLGGVYDSFTHMMSVSMNDMFFSGGMFGVHTDGGDERIAGTGLHTMDDVTAAIASGRLVIQKPYGGVG